jgi:hypothetical protein
MSSLAADSLDTHAAAMAPLLLALAQDGVERNKHDGSYAETVLVPLCLPSN